MDDKEFYSETAAQSCLIMYRMGGLRHVLLYLHDLLRVELSLSRINALYCYKDASCIINMADTNAVSVSNKFAGTNSFRPLIMSDQIENPIIINDLTPYHNRPEFHSNPLWSDMPYLHHKSLLRIPLFINNDNVFLINFWSEEGKFKEESFEQLGLLLAPFAEELYINLSGMKLQGAKPSVSPAMGGMEKLELCPGLLEVKQLVKSVARAEIPVLLLGETGVGKEAVADAIQELSPRKGRAYVKVNCGAIPEELIDSELFGHEKGAFTGATRTRSGYFEMADGGTLFLDEIGEMSLASQVRLLRVLDTGMIRRVGGTRELPVDVRIIAATHDDLPRKVVEGKFRRDLWYRLSVLPIDIPPLRKRLGDIPILVKHFLQNSIHKFGLSSQLHVTEREMNKLLQYAWPGNVRELKHTVERALVKYCMDADSSNFSFPLVELPEEPVQNLRKDAGIVHQPMEEDWPSLREMEDRYIRKVLEHCGGKLTGADSATSVLDIHYTTLRSRMSHMGLNDKE